MFLWNKILKRKNLSVYMWKKLLLKKTFFKVSYIKEHIMENLVVRIFRILKDGKYHTSLELADILNISDRTCRKYIKILSEILIKKNVEIESKPRFGYLLKDNNISENELFHNEVKKIPNSANDRLIYLINKLISEDRYIKLFDVSEEIYTSSKTLSQDLKKVSELLENYNLFLERKPYYGIRLQGNEIDIRNFYIDVLEKRLNENDIEDDVKLKIVEIAENISINFRGKNIKISDISLQNLAISFYVTLNRIDKNYLIEDIIENEDELFKVKKGEIKACINDLKNIFNLKKDMSERDVDYLTIRFMTTETMTYSSIKNLDVKDIQKLIEDIFFYINVTFKIDLSNDEMLYKNLYTHLIALVIRLRFSIKTQNPLIDDIKKNIPFEYNLSQYVCSRIGEKYSKELSEDEVGYIAVILHMAKEINKRNRKKNILLICPSGRGISKFLTYTFKNSFSEYLNEINACGLSDLKYINLDEIDIVFSLVDDKLNINKPVYKIKYFLNSDDLENIKKILDDNKEYVNSIFTKELFFHFEEEINKKDLISFVSNKFKEYIKFNDDLESLIIEREKLGMTEISEDVAIPHPIHVIPSVNKIAVCLLDKSIKWINNEVKIVLFMLINNSNGENEKIYKLLTKVVNDKKIIDKILKNPIYENYINILKDLEEV
jgi:PTS modulated transcriptional regulator, mtlR family